MLDPVRYIPVTLVVCSNPSKGLLGCLYSVSSGHLGCAFPPEALCGSHLSGSIVVWTAHLSCASFKIVYTLCIPALFRTSVSGILSCHLIFRSFLRQLKWKWLSKSFWHGVGTLSRSYMHIRGFAVPQLCRLSTLCKPDSISIPNFKYRYLYLNKKYIYIYIYIYLEYRYLCLKCRYFYSK